MLLSRNGYRNRDQKKYFTKEENLWIYSDEIQISIGNDYFWLWVAIELDNKSIFDIYLSAERNMFVAEKFIHSLV